MTLLLLAYLGAGLVIISPCILPVLPFVFACSDHPFASSGLPMLIGMVATSSHRWRQTRASSIRF
jgi:cytochrome c biogenesis protein CcdA